MPSGILLQKSQFPIFFFILQTLRSNTVHFILRCILSKCLLEWLGGAIVLGKLPVPGRPTIWIIVGQGPIALAVGAGGGCLDIFTILFPFFPLSPSLWETARYGLKYCLKGPLSSKQPTNQPTKVFAIATAFQEFTFILKYCPFYICI